MDDHFETLRARRIIRAAQIGEIHEEQPRVGAQKIDHIDEAVGLHENAIHVDMGFDGQHRFRQTGGQNVSE